MTAHRYPDADAQPHFPTLELGVLAHWESDHTFEASVEQRPADAEYVFYDGPPFATGTPHYGHLLAGTIKDIVPLAVTMREQIDAMREWARTRARMASTRKAVARPKDAGWMAKYGGQRSGLGDKTPESTADDGERKLEL